MMSLTLSLSLNCSIVAPGRSKTVMLPLAWLTLPLAKWQAIASTGHFVKNALTFTGIMGRSLAWGVGL